MRRQLKITQRMTNREAVSIDKYLLEVSREKMITAEEEADHRRAEPLHRADRQW